MLCGAQQTRPKKSARKQKSATEQKSANPRKAQSFNEPSCFARTHSHDVGTRTKKPVQKPQLCFVSVHKKTSTHQRQHTRRTATPTQRPPPRRQTDTHPPRPPPKHQPTNAKFWHEFWNNAMEFREHGNAFCNEYEIKLRSYVTNDGRQKRPK